MRRSCITVSMKNESLLTIDNLSFSYDGEIEQVRGVSMELHGGRMVGVIGPNGAGKSTLLKAAAGILNVSSGRIEIRGRNLSTMPRREVAVELGYMPQHVNIVSGYSVEQVVAMGRYCHLKGFGFSSAHDREVIEQAMAEAEVLEFRGRDIAQLSGGEQQRVLLGSVLAQEPNILLLDEPTTGLDLHHQGSFFALLARQSQAGKAVMVVTHDLNLAAKYCDELVLMHKGEKIASGVPGEVITAEHISQAYNEDIIISKHPETGRPLVFV